MSRRGVRQVFIASRQKQVPDLEDVLAQRVRSKFRAEIEGHLDVDADEVFQASEITPDQIIQLKFEALDHRQDELMNKISEISKEIERGSKPRSSEISLEQIKDSFARMELVKGVYALSTQNGYEIAITYPESIRLGEVLKKLVPIEIELSKKFRSITMDFEYIPASDFSNEMKSSFKVLMERQEPHSSAG